MYQQRQQEKDASSSGSARIVRGTTAMMAVDVDEWLGWTYSL